MDSLRRFRPDQHLRQGRDFQRLRREGKTIPAGPFLAQILRHNPTQGRRLGVIASRRVGNAVVRNRARRLLRELFRLNQEHLPPVCDLVLIARHGIRDATIHSLQPRFEKLCRILAAAEGVPARSATDPSR